MHDRATFQILTAAALLYCTEASALHGEAIIIKAGGSAEIVIAYDPEDIPGDGRSYITSSYGFVKDLVTTSLGLSAELGAITEPVTVFLGVDDSSNLTYSISRKSGDTWTATEPVSYRGPGDSQFIPRVICSEVLRIDCTQQFSQRQTQGATVAFDSADLDPTREIPLIRVGPFPLSAASDLNVYGTAQLDTSNLANYRSARDDGRPVSGEERFLGSVDDALDYRLAAEPSGVGAEVQDREGDVRDMEDAGPSPPFERDSSVLDITDGFDPRLKYITVHCTGGLMSEGQVRQYAEQGRRNKGHGYIMPDGKYIVVQSLRRPNNNVWATKTETCLSDEAFGSMFGIELNYACDWRPARSDDPTDAQIARLAEVIKWVHDNVGPLKIVSHTYVDMGLRDGHTDPQGRDGFNWQALYNKLDELGASLDEIDHVDPEWAKRWPISRTDRAHSFPPVINRDPPTGRDECRRYAG
ncbi:hypothetical protein GOC07_30535 [Sinorhizobium meliloti]|nr:hypothetical protein [Sinorhizobium meliloti]